MKHSSIYKSYTPEELDSHLSNFLVSRWSYSSVTTFARHEKLFEYQYIYNNKSRQSATTVAGQAYHHALEHFFQSKKEGEDMSLPDLEILAYEYIDNLDANIWKIQKTTPTVDDCKQKANQTVTSLLKNFFSEIGVYLDEIEEIVDVEVFVDEFVRINGVDIPLPCGAKIDLVVKLKNGKHAVIDHKSKSVFTSEDEMRLSVGIQAITYVVSYEAKTGLTVDEVIFIENKHSQNRDKSPQLNSFTITIDDDTRRLYEALLYEPLRRMITAVNDPDYVYIINDADMMADRAELYEFWCKTQIGEIEDFDFDESKRELLEKRHKKIRDANIKIINPTVIKNFKANAAQFIQYDLSNKDMTTEEKVEHVLRSFGTIVRVAHKFEGYSSNTFLLEVSAGVKVSAIKNHRLDVANALNVNNVRIGNELMVHEGRSYVPVEFAKRREQSLMFEPKDLKGKKIPIGHDNFGNVISWDLENHSTPHMLITGSTGSGKSVSIRSTIEYLKLIKSVNKIHILDPKFEFLMYASDKKCEVSNDIIDIEEKMEKLVEHMNHLVKTGGFELTPIIIDEFADALANSRSGKELEVKEMVQVGFYAPKKMMGIPMPPEPKYKLEKTGERKSLEENLRILVQKGRSVGFRVIAATQRASAKIITGDTKANFPVVVSFRLPKEIDSRVVLDEPGAEALTGMGDGLIKSPDYPDTVRFQAYYKS